MKQEIIEMLKDINPLEEFDETTDLLEEFLDSMGLLLLINELEDKYSIVIPLDEIELESFNTIDSIVSFVERLKKE